MSVPTDQTDMKTKSESPENSNPNWKINVSEARTVQVSNISLTTSETEIRQFFSFSGSIHYVEMRRESDTSQLAYITFKELQGADTAMLLTGSTIGDRPVSITPAEGYQLPPDAPPFTPKELKSTSTSSAVNKAEDAVSTMLAKGFVLGKDALNKAKSLDENYHLTSNASATIASIDQKMGISEKLSIGTSVVNEKVKEMDQRFQVSEMTKSAFAAAEQTASNAGSAIMSNPYVLTGASWVSNALNAVTKAAEDVSTMTKDKVEKAEEEKKELIFQERTAMVNDFAHVHLDNSSVGEPPMLSPDSGDVKKFADV